MKYQFFIGILILAFIWAVGFLRRKDLRWPMIWSGFFYAGVLAFGFTIFRLGELLFPVGSGKEIVPGYWNPNTLFDLGRLTGGYSIEDGLFMFFVGGITAYSYELFFKKRIKVFKINRERHLRAILVAATVSGLFGFLTDLNLIYSLMTFGLAGTVSMWVERPDLISHSIKGGGVFVVIYILAFYFFTNLFPNFVTENYNLKNITGLLIFGIPLEEFLYALSFGLMWAPIYEYEHGAKDTNFS
ncbi:MAG: hypothetical protein HYZ51_04315 [Candidatus Doudnabacteria bacterium]|nr:hypothetical protein [Candidatus Doudnabacteria bacterium]